jgi:aldehyde:ferredoxin oxidoreductase
VIIDGEKCQNCDNCYLAYKNEHGGNDWPGYLVSQAFPEPLLKEILASLSGESLSMDALKEAGMRVMCLERFFNMREWIRRKDDSLPDQLLKATKPDGPTKGEIVPLDELKDDFYNVMGYDLSTGNPSDSLLA